MLSVSKTVDMTCEAQQKLMNQVASAYIDKMNTAFHGQIEALIKTIESTCRYQERTVREVTDALSTFNEAKTVMRDIKNDAAALLERIDRLLGKLQQSTEDNAKANTETRALVDVQTMYMNELGDIRHELEEHVRSIRKATEEYISYSSGVLTDTSKALKAAGSELTGSMTTARDDMNKDMKESIEYFETLLGQIIRRMEKSSKSVKDTADELPKALSDATASYVKELTALTKALADKRAGLK